MNDKTIPLQAVRDALLCATLKSKIKGRETTGKPHGRFAAFTRYTPFSTTCADRRRGRGPLRFLSCHFGPMTKGDLDSLLQRVRMWHGLAEVRRTWGIGMRALKAEFADGVMR